MSDEKIQVDEREEMRSNFSLSLLTERDRAGVGDADRRPGQRDLQEDGRLDGCRRHP